MEDIEDFANGLRAANIPWEAYQRGKMITSEQLEMIRAYDKKDAFVTSTLLDRHGKEYAKLFLNFLKLLNKDETIQYVLTMIDDMLTANPERVKLFHSLSPQEGLPFAPLLKCLDRDNDYIMQVANKIITGIICSGASITDETLSVYLRWLLSKLRNPNPSQLEIAIQALMNLFLIPEIRIKFMEMNETVSRLTEVIRSNNHYQIQYQVVYCFWLLSFTKEIAEKLREWNIVPLIVETIKSSIKEKVIRVCLATFRNLIEKAPEANSLAMSDNKVLALCQTLSSRKWSDEDIVADLDYLIEELQKTKTQLTSFDEYAIEVRSGRLEWSPPHKTEAFWKQNSERLNEKDYELIRILVRLLNTSTDSLILSVAANDIGEYARCHPRGKKILQQLGAKQRIMELMSAPDPTVRYHSLIAVQKFMVHNWEYLSKTS